MTYALCPLRVVAQAPNRASVRSFFRSSLDVNSKSGAAAIEKSLGPPGGEAAAALNLVGAYMFYIWHTLNSSRSGTSP